MRHRTFGIRRPMSSVAQPRMRPTRRRLQIGAAAAVLAVTLSVCVGCTSGSESSSSAAAASSASSAAPAGDAAGAAAPAAGGSTAASSGAAAVPAAGVASGSSAGGKGSAAGNVPDVSAGVAAADRQVIRTATVTLNIAVQSTNKGTAADQLAEQAGFTVAVDRVQGLATGGGYVGAADGQGTTMSITLRIPAGSYDSVMTALAEIGKVTSLQENTQDVTAQMIDVSSRVATMTASVNRVRALLSKADKIGDVISIESELTTREADLESLQRQQAALAGQTALSTITVVLLGSIVGVKAVVPPAPVADRSGFVGGLINGWHGVRHLGHAVLTVVGTLIPFLPFVLVLAIAVLIWRRRVRRSPVPTLAATAGDPHRTD